MTDIFKISVDSSWVVTYLLQITMSKDLGLSSLSPLMGGGPLQEWWGSATGLSPTPIRKKKVPETVDLICTYQGPEITSLGKINKLIDLKMYIDI